MSEVFLIAEIGLIHNTSLEYAKEAIRVAKESGADIVKSQAGLAKDLKGSMPIEWYEQRQLSPMQCIALIQYARDIGTDLFFSIFSKEYDGLRTVQRWHKFSANQTAATPRQVERQDRMNVIASVKPMSMFPRLGFANILYACPYLAEDPNVSYIQFLSEYYGRQCGYSDHTIGVDWCIRAQQIYGAKIIEKHFTLTRDVFHNGVQMRDAIHGALPGEFEQLARKVK